MRSALLRKAGLLDDETELHLLALSVILIEEFGPEVLGWEYATIKEELNSKWGTIGPLTWERIQALIILHSNNSFWEEWEVFEKVTAAMCGEVAVFSHMQPPESEEMAISISTARRVDGHEYSDEVKTYICSSALFDGLWYFSGTPLEIAQDALDEYDNRIGIRRDYKGVRDALRDTDGFYDPPETSSQVQANKVREVEMVLAKYNKDVDTQLAQLPSLLRRFSDAR